MAAGLVAMGSWSDAARDNPGGTLVAVVALVAATAALAAALRWVTRRSRSLRTQVLAVSLAALVIGALGAVALARLMILDGGEARTVLGILGVTAGFATVLAFIATEPLGRDARRLEQAVRQLEAGDREVHTGVRRADELGHVGRALDELAMRLGTLEHERAGVEAERTALLSHIGHDLRTPLAALRAAVEALADGVAPDPDRYLRAMERDVDALSALVDDLFLLARLEAGRLELPPEPVDLAELADEAVEALAPVAGAQGVHVALEVAQGGARVRGNPAALGRIIRNLLDNALRYAPAGSTVRVVVEGGTSPTVRVVDEGPGFPTSLGSRAFDRFTRADPSRARSTGGAGLGLAIARGLVEAHGGRIWIEAQPGGQVAFALPAA